MNIVHITDDAGRSSSTDVEAGGKRASPASDRAARDYEGR